MDDRDRGRRKPPSGAALLEKARQLRAQALQHDYDVPAWEQLADDLKAVPAINDDVRAAYEEFLAVMPSAPSVWVRYSELEIRDSNFENAKLIFGRCLLNCPTVEMHQQYLRFIKRINEGRGAQGLVETKLAYEFSLDTVGQDLGAGGLWQDYIALLQSPKPGSDAFKAMYASALEGQEEAARNPVVRRAYQRAVVVPSVQVEALWRSYEQWESKVDKQLAKKMLDEWRPRFQAARTTMRDRRRRLDSLDVAALPFPPGKGGYNQGPQHRMWMHYLAFEKSNPQRLEPDSPALSARVALAYGQCLTVLWHHPEVWYDHALTQLELSQDRGLAVLQRAQRALPGCSLLRLAQAEIEEAAGRLEEAKQVYESLAVQLEAELPPVNGTATANGTDGVPPAGTPSPFGGEQGGLIWVQYMRFLRRTGQVPLARQLFLRARKWQSQSPATQAPQPPPPSPGTGAGSAQQPSSNSGWQIYAVMARMEWGPSRSNAALPCKIFELGLEEPRLAKDPAYVLAYHQFLVEAGDIENARALFERALVEPENSSSPALWRAYALFEWDQGELVASAQVQQRMRSALGYTFGEGTSEAAVVGAFTGNMQSSLALALKKYGYGSSVPANTEHAGHLQRMAGLEESGPSGQQQPQQEFDEERGGRGPEREGFYRRDDRFDRDRRRSRSRSRSPPRRGGPPPFNDRDGPPRHYDRDGPRGGPPGRGPPPRDEGPPLYLGPSGLPEIVEALVRDLPPPMSIEGPPVPVEAVMDVIMFADLSPAALAQAAAELDSGHLPSGANGIVPNALLQGSVQGGPPPPLGDPGYPPPAGLQGPPMGLPPHPGGPPPPYESGPPPGHGRKRRWDGGPDYGDRGYSGGGGPPPGEWEHHQGGPPPPYYDDRRR